MQVTIADESYFIVNKLYAAAHTCYSSDTPDKIYHDSGTMTQEDMLKTINHCIKSGHLSVIEHQHLTFFISGISRVTAQQLTRHRLPNYSMASQRYITFADGKFDYVIPPAIMKDTDAKVAYIEEMERLSKQYATLVKKGIPAEDARYLLPGATCTNLTMTVELRELIWICKERLCNKAQWEIRQLVHLMKNETVKLLPFLEPYLQPKCVALGYCPESKKRSCGRCKVKADVLPENTSCK